jgi:hypothetical protein
VNKIIKTLLGKLPPRVQSLVALAAAFVPARGGSLDLSSLVNSERLRATIRRTFDNSVAEVFGEIFQNAQRARATRVRIETVTGGLRVSDDGHGVAGGLAGFHTLLSLGDSFFDNPTVADQHPMGIGLQALLASEAVSEVTFTSGGLTLTVDTSRWWTDPDYYRNWHRRVRRARGGARGMTIEIKCAPDFAVALEFALGLRDFHDEHYMRLGHRVTHPALGYHGFLHITYDGREINTGLPGDVKKDSALIRMKYEGCDLHVWHGPGKSYVNFYGQLIHVPGATTYPFYLEVRSGRPVNPIAPTRKAIVEDEALSRLTRAVDDAVFDYLFDPANRVKVSARMVEDYYALNPARARREAPLFVATPWCPLAGRGTPPGNFQELSPYVERRVFDYSAPPRLIADGVSVDLGDEPPPTTYFDEPVEYGDYGVESFLHFLGETYHLTCGDTSRLRVEHVWWRPGEEYLNFCADSPDDGRVRVFSPGHYGTSDSTEEPPAEWLPAAGSHVFAFYEPSNWNPANVHWLVGTTDFSDFARRYGWAAFDPENDEVDYGEMEQSYDAALDEMIRCFRGNWVARDFTLGDLGRFLPTRGARISRVEAVYEDESATTPAALIVTNAAAEQIRLRVI